MPLKIAKLLFFCLAVLFFSGSAFGATVSQLKGTKVLVDSGDDEVVVGSEYYVVGKNKKNTGSIIKITSIRGDKAVAIIIRGNVSAGEGLKLKPKNKTKTENTKSDTNSDNLDEVPAVSVYRYQNKRLSLLVNFMINSMSAKESDGVAPTPNVQDVKMTGTTLGLTAALDYPYTSRFEFRGTVGYEPFAVSGTAEINGCNNTTSKDCNASISYLVGGAYARVNFYQNKFLLWTGLGMTGRFPVAKTSTAIKTGDLKLTSSYAIALGGDYYFNFKSFVPFSIEQQFLQSSSTVSGSLLSFRLGYGMAY